MTTNAAEETLPPAPVHGVTHESEARASAEAEVHRLVWSGFEAADEIAEHIDWTWGWDEPLDHAWLRRRIAEEFARKMREEADWPAVTDNDRLDRVFAELNRTGVIALQNAGTTQEDGLSDVAEDYQAREDRAAVTGWCYYHGQDIETAMASGELFLAFGAVDGDRDKARAVAVRIRTVLEQAGFRVEWDGDPERRLRVSPFVWRRRNTVR